MLQFDELKTKYKKRIKDLFKDFLQPKYKCLNEEPKVIKAIIDTTRSLSTDENFCENLNKTLQKYIHYRDTEIFLNKTSIFSLINTICLDYNYEKYLTNLLCPKADAEPSKIKKWEDIAEDFIKAFKMFLDFWEDCEDDRFDYAEELFHIIYNNYPQICTEAFPIVLYVFTDSYHDFCKIYCRYTKHISDQDSAEKEADILALFKKRIYSNDFQYYLFSLIDTTLPFHTESSFDKGRNMYTSILDATTKILSDDPSSRHLIDPITFYIQHNPLLDEPPAEYVDLLNDINAQCTKLFEHFFFKSFLVIYDFFGKYEEIPDAHLNECKASLFVVYSEHKNLLADIFDKYMPPSKNPFSKSVPLINAAFNEFEKLLSIRYTMFIDSLVITCSTKGDSLDPPYIKHMKTYQKIVKQIEHIVSQKYIKKRTFQQNGHKYKKTISPCRNFEALWKFMHSFSPENEPENYWSDYDKNFTLFTLNRATRWLNCMILSSRKNTHIMFYDLLTTLPTPATVYHINFDISKSFDMVFSNYENLDQKTYSAAINFQDSLLTLYDELVKDLEKIFETSSFSGKLPNNVLDYEKYYDEIWKSGTIPSIEDLKCILAIHSYFERTNQSDTFISYK